MIDLLNDWLKGKETDKQIVYGFLSFRLYYQFHAYLSWFSVGSPSSVQQDCHGCSWGYRGPCWLALITVTAGKNPKIHVISPLIERKIPRSDLHFKPLSKNPSHRFPQQISDMCCFFLSKKYLYAFWFNSVCLSDFFCDFTGPWREILLSHSPTEARLHTMETTAGCGVATNGPLHGGRCLGNPVEVKLHPVEGQAFLEICQCF